MATLPDIDTTKASFLAYWNALDQGGLADIAPEETLNSGNVTSSAYYDNGVTGTYELLNGRKGYFRVKSDGWIVTYLDRRENYYITAGTMHDDPLRGSWDVLNSWEAESSPASIQQNALERAINNLFTNLSNSGNGTYDFRDVGLYNYEYDGASTVTNLSTGLNQPGGSGQFRTTGFSYTSETTRHYHSAATAGRKNSWSGGPASGTVTFETATVLDTDQCDSSGSYEYAPVYYSIDVMGEGLAPNSGTEYNATWSTSGDDGRGADMELSHLVLWS
jgi:hypothetical protein